MIEYKVEGTKAEKLAQKRDAADTNDEKMEIEKIIKEEINKFNRKWNSGFKAIESTIGRVVRFSPCHLSLIG